MALNSRTPSYLQPTASTAQRVASSAAAAKRARPPAKRDPPRSRALLSSGDDTSSKGESKLSVPKSRVTGEPAAQPSQQPLQSEGPPSAPPEPPHDALQIAAQVQPWLLMQSNLQDSLSFIRKGAQDSHNALSNAIPNDSSLGVGTSRLDAEKLVTLLDGLTNEGPDSRSAVFIHQYLEHEKSWLELQSELSQFFARLSQAPTDSPLEEGQNLKARLSEEASRIKTLLTEADSWRNEADRTLHNLAQLYPILLARSENASIASDAIECSLDNIRAMRRLRT